MSVLFHQGLFQSIHHFHAMTFALVIHRLGILLCLQLLPTIAQTYHNISLGSSLTASDDNSSWLSPSGDFAFGFQRIGMEGFLLSIWFNNIPEKTIVWFARTGTETLVQKGSKVELTNDGNFLLYDNQGQVTWNSFKHRVAYASMLDTGNFILVNEDFVTIWQSFGDQTDTILPTQILDRGSESVLVSRHTQTSYSRGRFQLQLQSDGNLVLYTAFVPSVDPPIYWESSTKQTGFQMVFNQSGYIYLTQTNGSILINLTPANVTSTSNFYHRATLDYDGVLRQYVYPKMTGETRGAPKSWVAVWSVPLDICSSLKDPWGSGACGYNSYCRQDENHRPTCECPPGYNYTDPSNKLGGCSPNFVPQSCNASSQKAYLFDMKEMPQTDFYGHDYEGLTSITEDSCKEACLNDCLCAIALFKGEVCWKKGFPFTNGLMEVGMSGKIMVKVGQENFSNHPDNDLKNEQASTKIFIKQLLLGGSMAINLIFMSATILFTMWRYRKRSQKVLPYMVDMNVQAFTYKELALATNSFKEELGRGASATVYKAVLPSGQRHVAAVKKLEERVVEGEKEFLAEVKAIGQTKHKNLVQLLGFCYEGTYRLLVYEFMSKGSLASHLFGSSRPKWYERIQIAYGIARGLTYLHEECSTPVIHCDIKPENILLDDCFTARISDFGLAKLLTVDQTRTTTDIRGTRGYVAPEWFMNMAITVKVDVYSFGIMLFEIICCRRNVESELKDENKVILPDWAFDCYVQGRLDLLVEHDEVIDDMKRLGKVGDDSHLVHSGGA